MTSLPFPLSKKRGAQDCSERLGVESRQQRLPQEAKVCFVRASTVRSSCSEDQRGQRLAGLGHHYMPAGIRIDLVMS